MNGQANRNGDITRVSLAVKDWIGLTTALVGAVVVAVGGAEWRIGIVYSDI